MQIFEIKNYEIRYILENFKSFYLLKGIAKWYA